MDPQCPKCGAGMDEGETDSKSANYYSARQAGAFRTGISAERAWACTGCGYLELYVTPGGAHASRGSVSLAPGDARSARSLRARVESCNRSEPHQQEEFDVPDKGPGSKSSGKKPKGGATAGGKSGKKK